MRIAATVIAWAALLAPAHAEWTGGIHDRGEVRQASLRGMDDGENKWQITLLCTTSGDYYRNLSVIVALPATGLYAVRQGDVATVKVSMGAAAWEFDLPVENNGSSGFVAGADIDAAIEIVQAIESWPADVAVSISVGAIEQSFVVGTRGLDAGATEWLDACGR